MATLRPCFSISLVLRTKAGFSTTFRSWSVASPCCEGARKSKKLQATTPRCLVVSFIGTVDPCTDAAPLATRSIDTKNKKSIAFRPNISPDGMQTKVLALNKVGSDRLATNL
eukprot:CAMPEP_0196727524 /NCGR_PEP_ID=MMETSP1091-20130531/8481_1 /TAXON_ID=302021 /ORGANISM="Rhodomonas sp., Strain CCMP768" /LENGTH=111 /DNA_ID=CAMNT_0042070133 /DNA_START=180 /DNA_END=515 /DNA_ORIENTATION=+